MSFLVTLWFANLRGWAAVRIGSQGAQGSDGHWNRETRDVVGAGETPLTPPALFGNEENCILPEQMGDTELIS